MTPGLIVPVPEYAEFGALIFALPAVPFRLIVPLLTRVPEVMRLLPVPMTTPPVLLVKFPAPAFQLLPLLRATTPKFDRVPIHEALLVIDPLVSLVALAV